ncbi:MFS transporter [Thalassobacillus sp. CUG 92003]|uniref:MFS transporter n=1 Tax=Thalassobacillus sp. CUG 92003 TaxID=2736641 RepID=UPI0015E70862|nr:MFS transporter [Thalassobacillus sp. CUG 92003]
MVRFFRQWFNNTEISRDLVLLLIIGGLYALGIFLSSTFVNIYLWKQSNDYYAIAFYNLSIYILQPLTFILAGRWAKKIDRVMVLRTGVIMLSLFFLVVLLVGERAATFNVLLGSLLGIGYGFYWLAYNVLTFEITEPETRDFFNGFLGILQSVGGMIGPVMAGFIISEMNNFKGYTVIFSLSFFLFILAVIMSFRLSRRRANGNFSFRRIIVERKHNSYWKKILYANIFQGLREGTFLFVISIWVYLITQSELSLGFFNMVYSGFSVLFYLIVTRWISPGKRKSAIFTGGLFLFLSVFILLFTDDYYLLLLYAALIGMFFPVLYVPYLSLTYDVIGKSWQAAEMRIEYIVVRELFLNLGRVLSIIIFIIGIKWLPFEQSIPLLLILVGTGHFIIYFFVKDIDVKKMALRNS